MKQQIVILYLSLITAFAAECTTGCTIAAGYEPNQCNYYTDNDWWLPPNYVHATDCVCTDPSLNYPSINCVRKRLQKLHIERFSDEFKEQAKTNLDDFIHAKISTADYEAWSDMEFANKVKKIHDDAFEYCCCPDTPASEYFWHALFQWDPSPCWEIRGGQHLLSKCGCTGD